MPRIGKIKGIERTDRKSNFGISYPRPGETPKRVWYEFKTDRDRELNTAVKIAASEGTAGLVMRASDAQLVSDIKSMLPPGVDVREAIRFYLKHHSHDLKRTLGAAVHEYKKELQDRRVSQDYMRNVNCAMRRLEADQGNDCLLMDVTVTGALQALAAQGFAPATINNHHTSFNSFFNWTKNRGYIMRSPMDGMKGIKVAEKEPEHLTVSDVVKMFRTAEEHKPAALPFLALMFFGGLRSSAVTRLDREDINFEDLGIKMPGAKHKTGRRFYVDGYEANLWQWLDPWRNLEELPKVAESTLTDWREGIYLRAGVKYPKNAARHSFCTYHVAKHGDAGKTATLLTHRGSVNMLYTHYRGNASNKAGNAFFNILPA